MEEKKAWKSNGFVGLIFSILLLTLGIFLFIIETPLMIVTGILVELIGFIILTGLTVVQPNQAMVVVFFGKYKGVIRDSGFYFTIPFSSRKKVTLRVCNFNSAKLKVNDVEGNPIEIAAVVVYKVINSAKAIFDVDDYEEFVEIQSETALRHVATKYPYDNFKDGGFSLRGNAEEVSDVLTSELQKRLNLAGVEVLEARLTHLAYSTEIASAMLQRQQAAAILAARTIIVEGAVGMSQMAIEKLETDNTFTINEEQKVQMINNLMVAIVSERGAQPIINTGSND